jgi:hypothetical protein
MNKKTTRVGFKYPRPEDQPKFIEVDLMDGGTSDGIRVSYDFELNG